MKKILTLLALTMILSSCGPDIYNQRLRAEDRAMILQQRQAINKRPVVRPEQVITPFIPLPKTVGYAFLSFLRFRR